MRESAVPSDAPSLPADLLGHILRMIPSYHLLPLRRVCKLFDNGVEEILSKDDEKLTEAFTPSLLCRPIEESVYFCGDDAPFMRSILSPTFYPSMSLSMRQRLLTNHFFSLPFAITQGKAFWEKNAFNLLVDSLLHFGSISNEVEGLILKHVQGTLKSLKYHRMETYRSREPIYNARAAIQQLLLKQQPDTALYALGAELPDAVDDVGWLHAPYN